LDLVTGDSLKDSNSQDEYLSGNPCDNSIWRYLTEITSPRENLKIGTISYSRPYPTWAIRR